MSAGPPLTQLGAGLAAAGVAGLAAGRALRARRHPVPGERRAVPYGSLRGRAVQVRAGDGTRLHVEIDDLPAQAPAQGCGRDPGALTVVLSHGYGLNLDAWHHQRAALRGRYRTVLWDHRGHGRSARGPAGSGTIRQVGDDLRHVLDAVAGEGPLALVGHSMGGMAIMALAAADPGFVTERVRAVGFVATSAGDLASVDHGLPVVGPWVVRAAPYALALAVRRSHLVERGRRLTGEVEQRIVRRWSYASPVSDDLARFTARMIAGTRLEVISDFLPAFSDHDERAALSALAGREVLVLAGERDLMTPAAHSAEIARLLPGSEHVVVRSAGHLVMLEHPRIVDERLLRLLERTCADDPGSWAHPPVEVVSPLPPRSATRAHRPRRRRSR